jgi:hypothetical protein
MARAGIRLSLQGRYPGSALRPEGCSCCRAKHASEKAHTNIQGILRREVKSSGPLHRHDLAWAQFPRINRYGPIAYSAHHRNQGFLLPPTAKLMLR